MNQEIDIRYKNGKIYMISYEDCKKPYIGSTIENLNRRLENHISDYKRYCNKKYAGFCSSFDIVKNENCYIRLLEEYPCNNQSELEDKEQYYLEEYDCINRKNSKSKNSKVVKKYDYSKGQIYKITYDGCEKPYYGSTIQKLNDRLARHRFESRNTISDNELDKIIDNDNHYIELVENFPCNSKLELRIREQYFIDNFDCANQVNAYTSEEAKKEQQKKNQEKQNIKRKEVVLCECGMSITKGHLREHKKSKFHQDFINNVPIVELTEEEIKQKEHRAEIDKKFYEKNKVELQ